MVSTAVRTVLSVRECMAPTPSFPTVTQVAHLAGLTRLLDRRTEADRVSTRIGPACEDGRPGHAGRNDAG